MGFTSVNAFAPFVLLLRSLVSRTLVDVDASSFFPFRLASYSIIIGSLALALNVVPFIAAIPLLVPEQENMGVAYGIWNAFANCGESIVNVASGALQVHSTSSSPSPSIPSDVLFSLLNLSALFQDLTPSGTRQYSGVFYLLIALKSLEFALGGGYLWFDARYLNGYLRASQEELVGLWERETGEEKTRGIRGASKLWTRIGLGFGAASLVTAWVIYIYYAI